MKQIEDRSRRSFFQRLLGASVAVGAATTVTATAAQEQTDPPSVPSSE